MYLNVYDECSGYTWQYINDALDTPQVMTLSAGETGVYDLGQSMHLLSIGCTESDADFGIAYKGIDFAEHDDVQVSAMLLCTRD